MQSRWSRQHQLTRKKVAKATAAIGAVALLALVVGTNLAAASAPNPCQSDDAEAPSFCYATIPPVPLPVGAPTLTRESYPAINQSIGNCPEVSTIQRRLIEKQFKQTHKGVRSVISEWPMSSEHAWSIGLILYQDASGKQRSLTYRFRNLCPHYDPGSGPSYPPGSPADLPQPSYA